MLDVELTSTNRDTLSDPLFLPVKPSRASNLISFDHLLNKVGVGLYQVKALFILGLLIINDGAEVVVLSLLLNVLKVEWELTNAEIGLIGSFGFLGFLIGSILSGRISDKHGRRRPLLYVFFLMYLFGMLSAAAWSFTSLLIIRTVFRFLEAFRYNLVMTYLTEISPQDKRGLITFLSGLFWIIGELFASVASFWTLDGASSGNWRVLLIIVAQPAILGWIGLMTSLEESPRYVMIILNDMDRGLDILQKMADCNDVEEFKIPDTKRKSLEGWIQRNRSFSNTQDQGLTGLNVLLNEENKETTYYMWAICFIFNFVYYGIVFSLPSILTEIVGGDDENSTKGRKELADILISIVGEFPGFVIGLVVIEKEFFGRRRSIVYGLLLAGIFCLACCLFNGFVVWIILSRSMMNVAFNIGWIFLTELYPTSIRSTGFGWAAGAGSVGGATMPWAVPHLSTVTIYAPFLLFSVCCFVGAWCTWKIKRDTTKQELDVELKDL
jgi:MFS family permease